MTRIKRVAVLLTCHNRKDKTLSCLHSFSQAIKNFEDIYFEIFLVDDGSTDGTSYAVKKEYPTIIIINGSGNLFWAGGMRLAWETAIQKNDFSAFLLLNDDVTLFIDVLTRLLDTHKHSLNVTGKGGIYVGTTVDPKRFNYTYGGHIIIRKGLTIKTENIYPSNSPVLCHFTNANILWVCYEVVDQIGIFDKRYTHGIADYDYSLTAFENKIPIWVVPGICGYCEINHSNNWISGKASLLKRIEYLYSPKGLEYKEYMYYVRKHFPAAIPYLFLVQWLKTLFPSFWDKFKKVKDEE